MTIAIVGIAAVLLNATQHKKKHEDRFRKAEQLFIEQFIDSTQLDKPTYPKTLKASAKAIGSPLIEGNESA